MRKHLAVIVILMASIATHFVFFGHPKETVFDEVHFGKFASGYFTHEYFFDIHPPLGKLIISGAGYVTGFEPGFSFGNIGDQFPDRAYLWLRLLPTLAGVLLPLVIYLLVLELGFSKIAAFATGMMIVLENALLVQSKFMLLDGFLLLFGFSAWLMYALYRRKQHFGYIVVAAILGALALSVKWTGVTFLGVVGLFELFVLIKKPETKNVTSVVMLVVIPFTIYFSIFALHFKLLSRPGPGDAFMTQEFRDGKLSTFAKFTELNAEMYRSNARLTAGHPYSSKWYSWLFMARPIYYWNDVDQRIYLLGNPIIWWASTFGILYVLLMAMTTSPWKNKLPLIFAGAYLVNLLPFMGISRAMFLYHYFTAFIIAIMALGYAIDQWRNKKEVLTSLLVVGVIAFVFFAPLSYGTSLTEQGLKARMWFASWN